jgi:choline dehydrogenase
MTDYQTASPLNGSPFDYIVVGAGSAGSVIAARLSENPAKRVLLIEAGPSDRSPWIHFPMGYSRLFADPRYNWMYESESEPGLRDRTLYQPRGKVLGGSSSINGMMYVRGNSKDFDDWATAGCAGWSYNSVLPYFRKSEDQSRGANQWHGVGGPLKVSDQAHDHELPSALCAAARQAGLEFNDDFNGAGQDGFGYYQANVYKGRRWSAARGYLYPARKRSNLAIITGALVQRIVVEDGVARGVVFSRAGTTSTAYAYETIISAGTIASPQLLMLSGIGRAEHVSAMGISCVADAPDVGQKMWVRTFRITRTSH